RHPDAGDGFPDLRIIQRTGAHEDQMRARLGLAEPMHAAGGTEASMHHVAAVGDTDVVVRFAVNSRRCARETHIHRPAAGTDALAEPAPADPAGDRLGADLVAHRPAQTSTGHSHALLLCGNPACSMYRAILTG